MLRLSKEAFLEEKILNLEERLDEANKSWMILPPPYQGVHPQEAAARQLAPYQGVHPQLSTLWAPMPLALTVHLPSVVRRLSLRLSHQCVEVLVMMFLLHLRVEIVTSLLLVRARLRGAALTVPLLGEVATPCGG